jgi:predicted MFS family arabinose efflux permease
MEHLRIRFSLLAVSICLIAIVLGFAGGIDVAAFKKSYTESLVASYSVAGAEPVRNIEYAIKYGKPLTNFYGMNDLLSETQQDFPEISDVRIILPDGVVAYSLQENQKTRIAEDLRKAAFSNGSFINGKNYITLGNKYDILIPIRDNQKVQIGALDMVLDNSTINSKLTNYTDKIKFLLILIALVSVISVVLLSYFVPVIKSDGEIKIRVLACILISVLAVAQLVFGILNYNLFKKIYIETSKENTSMVVKVVQRDMNSVIQKGVPVSELNGIETWLNSIVQSVPEIESLYITNIRGEVFYKTKNLILMQEELIDPSYNYSLPLIKDNLSQKGLVNLVLSRQYIEEKLTDIALDTLTVLLTSFIFMTEIIITLLLFLKRRKLESEEITEEANSRGELTQVKMIRPIAFIFFFAFSLTTSFIPIVMRGFNTSLLWMPESLKLSLPISLEAFGTIISTIITGYVIHKKGWRVPFLYGILIVCVGSVLSGISFDGTMFVLSRLITGIGYGFSWMAMRGYVGSFNSADQTQGFSSLNSGIMSGCNCGIVLGAMIAESAGYSFVFFITLGILVISAVVACLLIKKNKNEIIQTPSVQNPLKEDVLKLVFNSKILAFVLLALVPASICGAFLTYLFPITATDMGVSSANIGRAFLMYGLFVVYLGPLFGKYVGSKISIKKSIIAANLVYALAILVFGFGVSATAAIAAVLLIGFSDSFGLAAQSSYFLSFDATKQVGNGISISAFSVFYKLGQMIGPLVFGGLIALGIGTGTKIIGTLTAAFIIAYIFVNLKVKAVNKPLGM